MSDRIIVTILTPINAVLSRLNRWLRQRQR
jgi:hypothetical protein